MMDESTSPASTVERISKGHTEAGFEAARAVFDRLLLTDARMSAQFCAIWRGRTVVDLWGGVDISEDSITGVFSCSKGIAALAIGLLVQEGALDLDAPVVRYWPEFGVHGKSSILVREALSHQAGLVGLEGVRWPSLLRSIEYADMLAASVPSWRPTSAFGYHALTIGVIIEELFRRITGDTAQNFVESRLRAPCGAEFWLGLPSELDARYRDVLPQEAGSSDSDGEEDGLGALAFASATTSDGRLILLPNIPELRRAGPVAAGGVGTARGLAGLYAYAATGLDGIGPLLTEATWRQMGQQQTWGMDRVLDREVCFAVVFMKPHPRCPFGSHLAFGHDGASGAMGFADPGYDLAFGYVPQRMSGTDDDRLPVELSRVVRRCIENLT